MIKRVNVLNILVVAVLLAVLSACTGKPGSGEIEALVLHNYYKNGGEELYGIENFEKTNGFEKSKNTYIADVKYILVFKKGIRDMAKQLKQESKHDMVGALDAGLGVVALRLKYGDFKAGFRVHKQEKLTLINTEKGWRLDQE